VRSRAASIFITIAVAGCPSHTPSTGNDASADGPQGPQQGSIYVFSGGSEVPPISPTVTLQLPEYTLACQSDVTVDGCRIRSGCNPTNVTPVSGGEITLGTKPPTTIVSTAPPPGTVENYDVNDISPGQPVTFAIAGTEAVPTMSASVQAPSQVTITSNFDGTRISKSTDYQLTWTGATTGTIGLNVETGIDGDFGFVNCSFPAASGSATLSTAALQMFPSGGDAAFDVTNAVTQQAGAWTIVFGVGYDALWSDGSFAQGVLNITN
jgi:hypothetical protein